ncbi:MAG: FkbM family methyltransferase [Desulfuromonadales bacterium]|nr:FkbM family methyltransferase [Desulfuromonadales bacterium]
MNSLKMFRPFLREPAKHLLRLIREKEYRRYYYLVMRYGNEPRYSKRTVQVGKLKLSVPDIASFLSAYREIFVENIYAFNCKSASPLILDCGANVGLSILYYKERFPLSRVVAYEADPEIFAMLRDNIDANAIEGVDLVRRAVWSTAGCAEFAMEGADGGRIGEQDCKRTVLVETESLSSILAGRDFDFVKIDIEGAEIEAFLSGEIPLDRLHRVFVEYHSFVDRPQRLGQLLDLFEKDGFRVHIHPPFILPTPFLGIRDKDGMDMQLNLFFWRG